MTIARSIPALLVLAACSSNPEPEAVPTAPVPTTAVVTAPTPAPTTPAPAAGALDPVGNYDLNVEVMGQTQPVTMSITKQSDGKLGGSLMGPDGNSIAISNATVDGRKLTLSAEIPNGPMLTFVFEFTTNDNLTGTIDVAGMGQGKITGTRKKN